MEGRGRKSVLERSWRSVEDFSLLRTVLPFVTAHTCRDDLRNPDCQWAGPTNTAIFLRGLQLCGKSRSWQELLVSKKKIGVTMDFSEITKVQVGKKTSYVALYFKVFRIIGCLIISQKCMADPSFLFEF